MKTKDILYKILSFIIIISGLCFNSCEPTHCAWCYERGTIHVNRDIEVCADNEDELWYLIDISEGMGYECELKDEDN